MTERWPELKRLFHATLRHAPEQRAAFLDEACGADLDLRAEVERLLAAHARSGSFEESPAATESLPLEATRANREAGASPLSPGTALGPYEIVGLIGAGGMGEVYQARDPRLKRDVAIKLISPALATDRDRLRRFEHEAQAIAALTHPNILGIYADEFTAKLLPVSASNIWTMAVEPDKTFTYGLRRETMHRRFRVEFDLSKPVPPPPPPW